MKRATPIGVALLIGTAAFLVFAPTSAPVPTCADLVDGGVADPSCVVKALVCPIHASDHAAAQLVDGGVLLDRPGQRYLRLGTVAAVWGGGLMPPMLFAFGVQRNGDPHLQVVDKAACILKPCDARCSQPFPVWREPSACVRAVAGGHCYRGTVDYGRNVFPASEADGGSCESVECSVLAGDDPEGSL